MSDPATLEHFRRLTEATTIDSNTLLSTDYFNHFNEVIMLLSMVGDMPDMLDDIKAWRPKTYREHFADSGLGIAGLAAECYEHVPAEYRVPFDAAIDQLNATIAEAVEMLESSKEDPDMFRHLANDYWRRLQDIVDGAGAIVHGMVPSASMDQDAIDALF